MRVVRPQSHLQKLTTLNLRANEDGANIHGNHEWDDDREIHMGNAGQNGLSIQKTYFRPTSISTAP
jgi:hypothetical protein